MNDSAFSAVTVDAGDTAIDVNFEVVVMVLRTVVDDDDDVRIEICCVACV